MEFRVLGPLEVVADGGPITVAAAKLRALLALLLLHANEPVSTDRLVEDLWAGDPPATAGKTLQTYVLRLRKLLGDDRIRTTPGGYRLRVEPDELDLDRFQALRDAGEPRQALALWRGAPLAEFAYEPWAQAAIARLDELRLVTLEERIDADLARRRHAELAGELDALIAEHPLRERLRAQQLLALYRSGRQAEALEAYRRARTTLVEELGIEPGHELQELNRRILTQDRGLDATAPGPQKAVVPEPGEPERPRPAATTSFIGRGRERRELRRLIRAPGTRLVTMTGPGGTGKTRLALEVSGELERDFRHGSVFVDLTTVSDADLVLPAIVSRLGLRESAGREALDALASFLRGRELLLVLDNLEQVLAAAPLVAELVERAPGPTLLVTSRAPLRVAVERVYAVPPLELPDPARRPPLPELGRLEAIRLFVQRARQTRADFELSHVNAEAVAELCVRLDGLPLALELAAARVRLLSPRAIVDRLGRRLDLLRAGAAELPERHRTLRAAIEWSYDLLPEQEQRLFETLGAFTGGFTLDGADAVAAPDGIDVLEGVDSLLANNLLRPLPTAGDEPRFGMLETIREYARERLAARSDSAEIRRRHGVFYVELAEQAEPELRASNQLTWLERLDAENDNLRAALAWTTDSGAAELGLRGGAALWRYWQIRSLDREGRERLERLLALDLGGVDPAVRGRALAAAGRESFIVGDLDDARGLLEASLPTLRRLDSVPWLAMSVGILGLIAFARGDEAAALPLLEESVELARASRDWWAQSIALSALAEAHRKRQELGKARLMLEEGLRAARECGDVRQIARLTSALGLVALSARDYERARRLFEEGLGIQRTARDLFTVSRSIAYLGLVARGLGDADAARRHFLEALAMQAETDDRTGLAATLELLAEHAAAEGRTRRAVRLFSAAQLLKDQVAVFPMNQLDPLEIDAESLRARLDAQSFEEAWAWGRSMMLPDVVAYALEEEPSEPDLERVRDVG